jgi:hypothetical protein
MMLKLANRRLSFILSLMLFSALVLALVGGGVGTAKAATLNVLQDGADRLVSLQNNDGGWDWPLDDGNPASGSALNTIGPIAKGLAQAYLQTGDSAHRASLQKAGSLLLSKTNYFSPPDGYLAAQLDAIFGGTTYRDFVNTNYYGKLAAGTYDHQGLGILYNTQTYVQMLRDRRSSTPNVAAWDLGMGLAGAASAGASTTEWITGVKAEIDELDGTKDSYKVLGLAGAIYGLAFVHENYDPLSGDYASASSLSDLADILASQPLTSGADDGELLQRNAYAILALNQFNRTKYLSVIQNAADYLISVQKPTGGWGGNNDENNEMTGETLWAIAAAYPSASEGGTTGEGCFIATAAYGSYLDSHVDTLRSFRDQYLETNPIGSAFVSLYYKVSPPMADFIEKHPALKPIVRAELMPAVAMSSVALNTTLAEKAVILVAMALFTAALIMWLRRRTRRLERR